MTPSLSLFMAKATLRYPLRHHRPPNVRGLLRNPKSIRAFGVSRRSCVALDLEPTKYVRYGFIQDAVGHPLLARSALGAASKIDVMVLPHPDRSRHACHPLPSVTLRASVSSWTFLLDKSTVIPCQMQWGRTWTPCDAHVQCHWNAKKVSSCHVACLLCLLSLRSAIQPTLRSLLVEPSVGFFHAVCCGDRASLEDDHWQSHAFFRILFGLRLADFRDRSVSASEGKRHSAMYWVRW
jgi:hypothetical protein